jgi:hypothetical protein
MRRAIDGGLGVSTTYSLLANFNEKAGNTAAAEAALEDGTQIFANSVFLRIRYCVFLESLGRTEEAANQRKAAEEIDARQARGWYEIMTKGSVAATEAAANDAGIAAPSELEPNSAVRIYLDPMPGI